MNRLQKAIETLKGYCDKQISCEKCKFTTDVGCFFVNCVCPCDWDSAEILLKHKD